jgi:hypothetical protein
VELDSQAGELVSDAHECGHATSCGKRTTGLRGSPERELIRHPQQARTTPVWNEDSCADGSSGEFEALDEAKCLKAKLVTLVWFVSRDEPDVQL